MKHSLKNFLGFTLVELIVVITIVGILSTVGFVSYSNYLTGARDSNRYSQMTKLSDSLQVYSTTKSLPLPDDYVEITASGTTIAYQGYIGVDVLETIDYTNGGKDPKDDSFFTYYLTKDRKMLQLLAFMEDEVTYSDPQSLHANFPELREQVSAASYEDRFPKFYGKKLGILVSADPNLLNTPIQEISSVTSSGYLDVVNTADIYKAFIDEDEILEGTGSTLYQIIPNGSCKRIKQVGNSQGNGTYTINPAGIGNIKVYCDMEAKGGGWTLVVKTTTTDQNLSQSILVTEGEPEWKSNQEYKLSIDYWKWLSTESAMAYNLRIDGLEWYDKTDGVIQDIDNTQVNFSVPDEYYLFNLGTYFTQTEQTIDGTYYWNYDGTQLYCARCVNYDPSPTERPIWGDSIKQPGVFVSNSSTSVDGVEGAGGTRDDEWHVLAKMGIFLR